MYLIFCLFVVGAHGVQLISTSYVYAVKECMRDGKCARNKEWWQRSEWEDRGVVEKNIVAKKEKAIQ